MRYPVKNFDPKFEQGGKETMNIVLNNFRMDKNRDILHILSPPSEAYNQYDDFASHNTPENPQPQKTTKIEEFEGPSGSLESFHNEYYGLIGGMALPKIQAGGHMSKIPVAACDPIFWMHHCQIDRLFAIWQAVHNENDPQSWFKSLDKAEEPLLPFRNMAGKHYWNSNASRHTQDFGYTYPEIQGTREATRDTFRKMYEWSVPLLKSSHNVQAPPEMEPFDTVINNSQFFRFEDEGQAAAGPATPTESISIAKQPVLPKAVELPQKVVHEDPVQAKGYSREWSIDDRVQR